MNRILLFAAAFFVGFQAHEPRDITAREIVDVLAEFDVRHADQQPFFPPAYGATQFNTHPPQVWIFNSQTIAEKRSTVLHELIHIRCRNAGVQCDEDYVEAEEARQYRAMYGDGK